VQRGRRTNWMVYLKFAFHFFPFLENEQAMDPGEKKRTLIFEQRDAAIMFLVN